MSEKEDSDIDMAEPIADQLEAEEDELLASSDSEDEQNHPIDEEDEAEDDLEDDEDSKLMKIYLEVLARIDKNKYSYEDYVLLVNTAQ